MKLKNSSLLAVALACAALMLVSCESLTIGLGGKGRHGPPPHAPAHGHRHKHQGNAFNVRVDLHVPGDEIVINRDANEDPYVALRDAFDAAKRLLMQHAQKIRGDVKHHSKPGSGNASPEEHQ